MPNHIKNKIRMLGPADDINKMLDSIKGDAGHLFDFEKIIPFPVGTDMHVECNSVVSMLETRKYYWQRDVMLETFTAAVKDMCNLNGEFKEDRFQNIAKALKNYAICGYASWHDWSVAHWGTKWNSYDNEMEGEDIVFETAWSHPEPVVRELSFKWPSIQFTVRFADEDIGSTRQTGHYVIHAGARTNIPIDNLAKFAVEELWSERYKSYEDYMKD